MSKENPLWGAARIHGELLMLGFEVAQSTVSKYMVRPSKPPSQSWKTFLQNSASGHNAHIDGGDPPVRDFCRNVFQLCDGGFEGRTIYFETVDWATSKPSISSSPWIRAAPHSGFPCSFAE